MILRSLSLPAEDEQKFSRGEHLARIAIDRVYRYLLAVLFAYHTFDFLFSPIWMHGYVWSLNLPIELDMADKSAGLIVDHQLTQVGYNERIGYSFALVLSIALLLSRAGFLESRPQKVGRLVSLATSSALVIMFVRTLQRLFPAIHESIYTFMVVFIVGVCLCIRNRPAKEPETTARHKEESIPDDFVMLPSQSDTEEEAKKEQ